MKKPARVNVSKNINWYDIAIKTIKLATAIVILVTVILKLLD